MAHSRKRSRQTRKWPLWAVLALLTLLGVAALALSYVAVTGTGSGDHEGLPSRTEAATPEDVQATEPPMPAEEVPEAVAEESVDDVPQRLLAVNNGTGMRATAGTCENPGNTELSLDAGQTWISAGPLAETGATKILRLLPTNASLIQVVALDENCAPQVYRTTDFGTTWEGPASVAGTWYFDPANPTQVGAPDGVRSLTCEGAELAAAGDRAAVRCVDGSVITTTDRGITWVETTGVTGVLALNYAPESYVVVQPGGQACQGLQVTELLGDTPNTQNGCFETDRATGQGDAGSIAVAQSGNSTLLWVGENVVASTDGGRTWL